MWILVSTSTWLGVLLFSAWLLGNGTRRRRLGLFIGLSAPLIGWPGGEPRFGHTVFGVLGALVAIRAADLYRDPKRYSFSFRVWFMSSAADARKLVRRPAKLDWIALGGAAVFASVAGACLIGVLFVEPDKMGPLGFVLRWALGVAMVYCVLDAVSRLLRFAYQLGGLDPEPFHVHPILSKTIREFWGDRWNRPTHDVLMRYCFTPLVRRRPKLAIFMTFVGSAALHFWITLVAVGWRWGALQGLFFLVQGGLVLLERRLRVARWKTGLQRTWTVSLFLLTSPMFVEPFLQCVGI